MNQTAPTFPDQHRRAFLRGRLRGREAIRPPWALPEAEFLEKCSRCGDCVTACAEQVLVIGDGGYPEVDFARGGCAMCGDCVERCRAGAFRQGERAIGDAWLHRVTIDSNACMAMKGVVCRTCGDLCGERAIRFQLRVGGAAVPLLDVSACTGCGECIALCPARAIRVDHVQDQSLGGSPDA